MMRAILPLSNHHSILSASHRSVLFRREPDWFPLRQGGLLPADRALSSWVLEQGSLTARLRAEFGAGFGVKVLRQAWGRPYPNETRALQLSAGRRALIREVVLHCGGRPLVLARSVIPETALKGTQSRLARLGSRPLGELLFAYRSLRRLSLELTQVSGASWQAELRNAIDQGGKVWGRRSVYAVAHGEILVAEFFLPAVLTNAADKV